MADPVKIIWASPPSLVRDGIITLLEQEHDFKFVDRISDPKNLAITDADRGYADLLIVDHQFLDDNQLLSSLKAHIPWIKILVLSDSEFQGNILTLMKSGADGYMVNNANKEELLFAIRHIMDGNTYICTSLYNQVLDSMAEMDIQNNCTVLELSAREEQILKLILEGYSNQEIAYQLFTNKRTILKYREGLLQKAGVADIGTVIRIALQQGVIN